MKILLAFLVIFICTLNASQFSSIVDLIESLKASPSGSAVGTLFATNFDTTTAASTGTEFDVTTGTCFAIGKRHLLTNGNTLKLIAPLKDCFINMSQIITGTDVMCPTFDTSFYQKVKTVSFEPGDEALAILELEEDLAGIRPLPLGMFSKEQAVMGISTAVPSVLGKPRSAAKLRHTFSYEQLSVGSKGTLDAMVVLPETVTADDVSKCMVPNSRIGFIKGYGFSSLFCHGDGGAPLLQGGKVVSVCDGWSLFYGSASDEPVNILLNKSIAVASHADWIRSIVPDVVFGDGSTNVGSSASPSVVSSTSTSTSTSTTSNTRSGVDGLQK